MNAHVGKPLDLKEVLQVLRQHLYRQTPSAERRKNERRKKNERRNIQERRNIIRRKDT
jgi:hypothetical protein